jgi:putative oxidoreductase
LQRMAFPIAPLASDGPYLALLVRLFLGFSLITHGYPKVKGGWRQSGQWMKSMGIPAGAAILATVIEFFGGLLLVVGLIVPVVAAIVAIQFASIVGMKTSKMKAHFISMEQGKPTYEIDAFYLALAAVLVVLGAGVFSLDSVLF